MKMCFGHKAENSKVKSYFLAQMGCRSGDGIWDKAAKPDLDQTFLVRGEDLGLISQAGNEGFWGKEKKK